MIPNKINLKLLVFSVLAASLLSGCSLTRHVPSGDYLLSKNSVKIIHKSKLRHGESFLENDLEKYIKQKPNKKFLGTNFYLWAYNLSDRDTSNNNWINKKLRKIGEEPVIYDSTLTEKSAKDITLFMEQSGFFSSKTDYKTTAKKRKMKVEYTVTEGIPYRLGKISYRFNDKVLEPIILQDTSNSLLKTGAIFNVGLLEAERQRIASMLQNTGYYFFNISNINYVADSTVGDRTVDIKMVVRQQPVGYDENGDQLLDNNKIYRIRNIYVNSEYDPTVALVDTSYSQQLDTTEYRGYNFIYKKSLNVRPDVLVRAIDISPGDLYNADNVQKAYKSISRLGYFKSSNFTFSEIKDTTGQDNTVTYVNSDGETAFTKEGALDFKVYCTPGLRQGYKFELEANTTSSYYGILARAGYSNRNIFKGAEVFDINLTGGYEIMRTVGAKNSYEFGISTSLTIPRFLAPFKIDRYNRLNNPRTKFEVSVNMQNRPYYNRVLSSAAFGYIWSNRHFSSFTFKPIDLNLIKLNSVKKSFLDSLSNPYLRNSYRSELLAGLSGSYNFNNQLRGLSLSSVNFLLNYETSGNLLALYSTLFSKKHPQDIENTVDHYRVFGVKYAQYFRTDLNLSYRYKMTPKSSIVYRFYAGVGIAYGNSTELPFERMFYSGGSNSMRGWQTRTLGPGSSPLPNNIKYPTQTGNLKLETNIEARFPVVGMLHGAVFFDLGNVFLVGKNINDAPAEFKITNFYKKLGFNTGIGARLDFGFFLFRLDWGIKLYDPNWVEGQRWIKTLMFRNTTLNFAVGYPF